MTNVAGRRIRHRPRHIGIDYSFGTSVKMERAKTRGLVVSSRGAGADRPGSFRIQAAHALVVTADTSFVNPFLHTKLWREE